MYNTSKIMARANKLAPTKGISQGEALHRSWNAEKFQPVNAARIAEAAEAAGVTEEVKTWKGWKDSGFEVIHGSTALFKVVLEYATKGDGKTYTASFFGRSQVHEVEEA